MSEVVLEEIRRTVAEVFFVDAEQVTNESTPESIPAWDSIGHLNLMLALEQRFGLTFAPEQFPQLNSIQAIASAVSAKSG